MKMRWIRPEDLGLYKEITYFKVIGRHLVDRCDLPRTARTYMEGRFDGNLLELLGNFSSERTALYPVKIDNRALDGFVAWFAKSQWNCVEEGCDGCNHCEAEFPDLYVCTSTIMEIETVQAAKTFAGFGADRIILAEDAPDLVRVARSYMEGSFEGNLWDLIGNFAPQRRHGFYVDNKALDGFVAWWAKSKKNCKHLSCDDCHHCDDYAKKAVRLPEREAAEDRFDWLQHFVVTDGAALTTRVLKSLRGYNLAFRIEGAADPAAVTVQLLSQSHRALVSVPLAESTTAAELAAVGAKALYVQPAPIQLRSMPTDKLVARVRELRQELKPREISVYGSWDHVVFGYAKRRLPRPLHAELTISAGGISVCGDKLAERSTAEVTAKGRQALPSRLAGGVSGARALLWTVREPGGSGRRRFAPLPSGRGRVAGVSPHHLERAHPGRRPERDLRIADRSEEGRAWTSRHCG